MSEWHKIETAPKDGSECLLYDSTRGWFVVGAYSTVYNRWYEPLSEDWLGPTHWMPLPQAPTKA
jgi:hypothetical protein